MTTEEMRYVCDRLAQPPFSKRINIIQLDAYDSVKLLQLLNDLFVLLEPDMECDLRAEAAHDTAQRMFHFLRVLKFRPPGDDLSAAGGDDPNTNSNTITQWRENFILGEKTAVIGVIGWMLKNWDYLPKRAYVGKYLTPLEIPEEFLVEEEIATLLEQYKSYSTMFKDLNRERDMLQDAAQQSHIVKNDLREMHEERASLLSQLERIKKRASGMQLTGMDKEQLLSAARAQREEQQRSEELEALRTREDDAIAQADREFNQLKSQANNVAADWEGLTTPDLLLKRVEHTFNANEYQLRKSVAPKVESQRNFVERLTSMAKVDTFGANQLKALQNAVREAQKQLESAQQRKQKIFAQNKDNEHMSFYRNQVQKVVKRKEQLIEKADNLRRELANVQARTGELEEQHRERGLVSTKKYRNVQQKFREIELQFRAKKAGLKTLLDDKEVQDRAYDRLREEISEAETKLEKLEDQYSELKGFNAADASSSVKTEQPLSRDALRTKLREVERMHDDAKQQLTVKFQDVKEIQTEFARIRDQFEAEKARFDEQMQDLEEEVQVYTEKLDSLKRQEEEKRAQTKAIDDELKIQQSHQDRLKSGGQQLIDSLQEEAAASEAKLKMLRSERLEVEERYESAAEQVKMWKGLTQIFNAKRGALEEQMVENGVGVPQFLRDSWILQAAVNNAESDA